MKTEHSSFILLLRQSLDFFICACYYRNSLRKHPTDEKKKTKAKLVKRGKQSAL